MYFKKQLKANLFIKNLIHYTYFEFDNNFFEGFRILIFLIDYLILID